MMYSKLRMIELCEGHLQIPLSPSLEKRDIQCNAALK